MQVLKHESAEFVNFDGEKSKNHRDAIPNNEHTEGMRHIDMPSRDAMSRIISGAMDADGRPPLDGGLTDGGKARLYSVFNWAEREAMMKPRSVE